MGRIYTVTGGQSIAASGTETHLTITSPTDAITKLRSIEAGQSTHEVAEMYDLEVLRASADGTGGTTPTPEPTEEGDAAFGATDGLVRAAPSGEPTYTADEPLFDKPWNSVLGLSKVWREGEMPTLSPGSILGIRETNKAAMTTHVTQVTATFEAVGG